MIGEEICRGSARNDPCTAPSFFAVPRCSACYLTLIVDPFYGEAHGCNSNISFLEAVLLPPAGAMISVGSS